MLFRSNDTATTEIYTRPNTLSLHDALPSSSPAPGVRLLLDTDSDSDGGRGAAAKLAARAATRARLAGGRR